jgi:hypothetical protein
MNKIKLAALSFAVLIGAVSLAPAYVSATTTTDTIQIGVNDAGGTPETDKNGKPVTLATRVKDIVNIFLFVIGAIAVVMIVVGGLRYTISHGDSSQIKAAKDTILYAVVGLVVAILAYAIVNFVITSFK